MPGCTVLYNVIFWLLDIKLCKGALIHKKDRNGDPPLVCAVLANHLEVIRLLVQVDHKNQFLNRNQEIR